MKSTYFFIPESFFNFKRPPPNDSYSEYSDMASRRRRVRRRTCYVEVNRFKYSVVKTRCFVVKQIIFIVIIRPTPSVFDTAFLNYFITLSKI